MEKECALDLYRKGLCDKEIAMERGVTPSAIRKWRKQMGLSPNNSRPVREKSKLSRDAYEARQHGMTYGTYKAMLYDGIPTSRTAWQRRFR